MGWRFRKRVSFGGLVRLNFSNGGVSLGLGPRGANINIGKRGVRTTVGLPGSGIYNSSFKSWDRGSDSAVPYQDSPASNGRAMAWRIILVVGGFGTLGYCVKYAASPTTRPSAPTIAASTSRPAPSSPAMPSSPSSVADRQLTAAAEVLEVQKLLYELGFDPGPRDGISGPATLAAIRRYEASRNWAVKGELDYRLLELLRAHKAGAGK